MVSFLREQNVHWFISKAAAILAVSISLYHVYIAYFGYGEPLMHRATHVSSLLALGLLTTGLTKKSASRRGLLWNVALAFIALSAGVYIYNDLDRIITRWTIDPLEVYDWIFSLTTIALLFELTRRMIGFPLIIVAALSLIYPFIGPYMPSWLAHSGMSAAKLLAALFLTMDGIFSAPTAASANFIFIYVLFGSFLLKSGAGEFFIDFAKAIAGGAVGGPAKIAVIASSLFGTVSGSPTANVVTTGTFTIPLMKKIGYSPYFAGAVEAVASTGGAIMPPVMHAAAFLMVEITGIPYLSIIKAAIFPALLFYFGLFLMVHFRALSRGLRAIPKNQLPLLAPVMRKGWHFLLPLVLLVVFLIMGYTVVRAGLMGIIGTLIVSWLRADTRMGPRKIAEALIDGAKSTIVIMACCATAGIVVGVIGATGLGGKFTSLVVSIGSGSIFLSLLLTMTACVILGMGLPTPVAYLLTAVLAGPALTMMGVSLLAAHLFILYYASLSTITPPVAVAAYAAAGIAGDSPIRTGFTAMRLASVAFIIPFMFVYQPALLLASSFTEIILAVLTSIIGVSAFSVGLEGWLFMRVGLVYRLFLILSGLLLIYPGILTDIAGMGLLVLLLFMIWRKAGAPALNSAWSRFCKGN